MPKVRAYGADATLKACREASYGVAPLAGYRSLDFKSTDLSSAQQRIIAAAHRRSPASPAAA